MLFATTTTTSIVSIIGLILGGIGILGIAYATFRNNLSSQTINLLQVNSAALELRNKELTEALAIAQGSLTSQASRVVALENIATHKDEIVRLELAVNDLRATELSKLDVLLEERTKRFDAIETALASIMQRLPEGHEPT